MPGPHRDEAGGRRRHARIETAGLVGPAPARLIARASGTMPATSTPTGVPPAAAIVAEAGGPGRQPVGGPAGRLGGGTVRRRRDRLPRLAAALAVVAGLVNLVSALLPAERDRLRLLHHLVPGIVSRGATVAVAAAGIGLLLLAGGL